MDSHHSSFWELLNRLEDHLTGGFLRDHPPVPRVSCAGKRGTDRDSGDSLDAVAEEIRNCIRCTLSRERNNVVPGEGVDTPLVMVIGEGPGFEEDRTGRPFVGKSGAYLDKWLEAIGLDRATNCFIGNIVKCRPPNNRDPIEEEITQCRSYLDRQIRLLSPSVILTVGRLASQLIVESDLGIGKLRGRAYKYLGIPVVPTYHPSGVLRNPAYRRAVWDDLQRVKQILGSLDS